MCFNVSFKYQEICTEILTELDSSLLTLKRRAWFFIPLY